MVFILTTIRRMAYVVRVEIPAGKRMSTWRRFLDLSLRQVHAMTGIDAGELCRMELGRRQIRHEHLALFCGAIGITLEEFYGRLPRAA